MRDQAIGLNLVHAPREGAGDDHSFYNGVTNDAEVGQPTLYVKKELESCHTE